MLKNSSEGLLSSPMAVPDAGVDGRCRLPSQAAFESHSSILRHASEVTRPVCASFLHQCGNHYYAQEHEPILEARHKQQSEFVRQLNAFYPNLHRCACQWPGFGMTIFFPGQRPIPDGHGVHSLPPPPRMYEPSWQGRH